MKETTLTKFCEKCGYDTVHKGREDALEIEYICTKCGREEDVVKTFF